MFIHVCTTDEKHLHVYCHLDAFLVRHKSCQLPSKLQEVIQEEGSAMSSKLV